TRKFTNSSLILYRAVVYKAPAQNIGKALIAGPAPVAWQNTPDLTQFNNNHAVYKPLEHVIAADNGNKFIAYNNIPPDIPKVKTKSNNKGVLMMNPGNPDEASWIVHTIPGFPKALTGYVFPPAEIQKGHLFICLTIKESEIDAIAMALRIATPLIYHNDIPDDPARPNLKKLVNGESRLTPPLTVTRQISTAAAPGLTVTIYSKGEKSKYEIYRRVLAKKLKTGIKVWTTRDKTLKSDCRILGRSIKLVTSPIAVDGQASSLESDVSQWLISDPGNKFCVIDKPYHKSQTKEPAMAVCIDDATIFGHFNRIGKALIASVNANAWQNTQDLTRPNNHAVAKSLEHVIEANPGNKFIAYNNIPPDVPNVKTKSNSKGVLMMNPNDVDDASWIVHTIPGFPKALRGYVFPLAEIQKGHLFICLTIKKSEIDAIAMALRIATPLIYHNDIPDDPARPNLKKLVNGGGAAAWQNIADLTRAAGHAVAKSLEHVIMANADNKFIAYNNIPPDVPKIKTKSNSKGVLMMNPRVADEASWIVHTVPGFPKALREYVFPLAEIQKGHLFICLTIKESEIDAIAMTLRIATPLLYHNDIPENEINSRPNLQNLAEGRSRFMPPLTVAQEISTAGPGGLKVAIYSKSEKSRYDIYRRVLVKKLKASIKVWTTRDKTLKSDCRILNRNIKLVTSPIAVDNQASSLESDVSQWLISEPGNKFCVIDKPYHKSQTKEPAIAVCIDDATIFGHFNRIGQNVENCA
ncbi:Plancitoxin-1, partial [Trichinella sp. T9]